MNEDCFVTERLQLAVYLHATSQLTLKKCELSPLGRVLFVFAESRPIGERAELQFDLGASAPATALFASQKYLRRKINNLINESSINEQSRTDNC